MNTIKFINQSGDKVGQEVLRIEAYNVNQLVVPRIGETILTHDCLMGYTVINIEYLYTSKKNWFGIESANLSIVVYVKE